ncbi:MAG TPA: hypothetical protein VKU36_01065 [Candidatus Babeliales bacterium]|jgi:hypothetical protein|nr:hypothetical protein [Candidatus Babeliales bacterium]
MKKLLLITFSFITLHVYAMKMEIETIKPLFPAGWLTSLPIDFTNEVAEFLFADIEETEQEFIQRTKALKLWREIPLEYLNHLPSYSIHHQEYLHVAESSDNNIVALLHKEGNYTIGERGFKTLPTLLIINKKNNQLLHNKQITKKEFLHIAVPRDGNRIGTLHSESYLKSVTQETFGYKHIVTVTNLVTEKIQTYDLPDYFDLPRKHPTIAFNKQGTDLIVHGKNNDILYHSPLSFDEIEKNPIRHHIILPLTKNRPDSSVDNKKTLQRYFAQHLICKDLK